jgi:GT2 family glycosyltransferase
MRFPKIVILILNWNGKKDTLECLASLEAANQSPSFATLVIDNGSTDDSVAVLRSTFPEVPILETKENLGFAGGNNAGIRWALEKSFDWILLLNNDTIVAPDFIEQFLAATKKKPEGKIFGAKIYRYDEKTRLDHLGGFWNASIAEFESKASGKIDDGSFEEMRNVDYACGCALLMHRNVPEKIGLLDEDFFLLWEETDFCMRARQAGFSIWTAPQAKLWHKVSASFIGGKPHMQYFWWRNRLHYIARNCTRAEKKELYRKILVPEILKFFKLALLKSAQQGLLALLGKSDAKRLAKARRYRAGCLGILHFFLGRFGNCPQFLLKKR